MRQDIFKKPTVIVKTRLPARVVKPSVVTTPVVTTPVVATPTAISVSKPTALHRRLPRKPSLPPALQTLAGWPLVGHPHQEHVPYQSGQLGGVQLYRCRCGLLLAQYGGALWWVPVTSAIERIETLEELGACPSNGHLMLEESGQV